MITCAPEDMRGGSDWTFVNRRLDFLQEESVTDTEPYVFGSFRTAWIDCFPALSPHRERIQVVHPDAVMVSLPYLFEKLLEDHTLLMEIIQDEDVLNYETSDHILNMYSEKDARIWPYLSR